jgi:chromate transporter
MASLKEALPTWFKIGCLSFGGPAGQIAMMQKMLVDEKKWIDEKSFLNGLNFCMLLPGPEAQQLATYIGWRMHGVRGALMAGLLFILPGLFVILTLSAIYVLYGKISWVEGLFYGLKAAVLMVVLEALLKIKKRALKGNLHLVFALASFIALYFSVNYMIIVVIAGILGALFMKGEASEARPVQPVAYVKTALIGLGLWFLPLLFMQNSYLQPITSYFMKLAVVTFGGAYAILASVTQEAVTGMGWLSPSQMIDGLALAETTPGPLILVLTFVGVMAGVKATGSLALGLLAGLVTTWATFVPSFLFIMLFGGWIEKINADPRLKGVLQGIMAAAVGVVAYVSFWFAMNVLIINHKPDFVAIALSLLAGLLLFRFKINMIAVMGICALLGLIYNFIPIAAYSL